MIALLGMYACKNDLDKVFDDQTLIEFQPAVLNANSVGRTYPTRIHGLLNSTTAGNTITAQVNLVGRGGSNELTVKVLPDPVGTTAPASSYTLSNGGTVVFAPSLQHGGCNHDDWQGYQHYRSTSERSIGHRQHQHRL